MLDLNVASAAGMLIPFAGSVPAQVMQRKVMDPWYRELRKPWFTPPRLAFPLVWSYIYASIGYASYMVYRDGGGFDGPARLPLMLYAAKMLVNWSFTPIFFLAKRKGLGCLSVAALWVMVGLTGKAFYEVNRTAGLVFIPYQVWCTLALAISYRIWKDNEGEEKKD